MKITTNFTASPTRLVRPLALVVWCLVGIFVGVAAWVTYASLEARNELPELRDRLAQLAQRQREIALSETPPAADLQELKQRVTALNALSGNTGQPVMSLLVDLEQWLPAPVRLVSLQDKVKTGEVQLVAEADRVEPLTAFLLKLEQQSRFSEVLLVKQTPQTAQHRMFQFEVRLKERP